MAFRANDKTTAEQIKDDENRDPITGTPGAHPVGVGTGAAAAGATGAVIGGAVGGPVGAGVGAVVGAVAGGLVGKGAAEAVNPTIEHEYWRAEYVRRPYVRQGSPYERYAPAYQYGWESYGDFASRKKSFDEIEPELRSNWEAREEAARLSWEEAREPSRDAWLRMEKQYPRQKI